MKTEISEEEEKEENDYRGQFAIWWQRRDDKRNEDFQLSGKQFNRSQPPLSHRRSRRRDQRGRHVAHSRAGDAKKVLDLLFLLLLFSYFVCVCLTILQANIEGSPLIHSSAQQPI